MDKQGSPFINSVQSDSDFTAQFVQVLYIVKKYSIFKAEASWGVLKECPFVTDDSFASSPTTPHTQSHFENVSQGKYDALVSVTISTITMSSRYKELKGKGSKGVSGRLWKDNQRTLQGLANIPHGLYQDIFLYLTFLYWAFCKSQSIVLACDG